jgi:hypothetical protein
MNEVVTAVDPDRRAALVATALKILLLLTFLVAYLNPILRAEEESIFTAYRVVLPFVAAVFLIRYLHHRVTQRYIALLAVVLLYSMLQMFLFDRLTDPVVWSYLINILAAILFVYFVYVYGRSYGGSRLFRHLYLWYVVLVVACLHQLATGFQYPNAPYREGVARIFFGQENDTSLALAAFLPLLLPRCRRDPLALLLLIAGVAIIYVNGTRGILVAVFAYPLALVAVWFVDRFGRRIRPLRPLLVALVILVLGVSAYVFKDTPIRLVDYEASLAELVLDPVAEIMAGQKMDAELTSVNLRVTLAIAGTLEYVSTFGVGIGPGASTYFVREYYPDIATGMHIFPLQLLVENGWLFVAVIIWISVLCGRRLGWRKFFPIAVFLLLATVSITTGAITNYFFFACSVCALWTFEPETQG